ncbi:hypothetical protein AaE_012951 [Aphanomyces astaci]|uniref:Uncharacterized protein n=1 Tax=Aphanomyces astaci TaxID=112090 RepID=A0A6A4Z9K3_APHAT|nr:hypothetical protein AaE_012951 [Aphanomyces astaci]
MPSVKMLTTPNKHSMHHVHSSLFLLTSHEHTKTLKAPSMQANPTETPPGSEISQAIRNLVISHHQDGKGYKTIGSLLRLPKGTVQTIVRKFKNGVSAPKPRSGRPRVTTESEDRLITREIKKNRRLSAETLQESLAVFHDKDISTQTIRRRIKAEGLNGRAARRKPFISKANKGKRLAYAKNLARGAAQ